MNFKVPSDVVVGQYLQYFTLIVAASIAFVYTCGYTFGLFIHELNDKCTQLITTTCPLHVRRIEMTNHERDVAIANTLERVQHIDPELYGMWYSKLYPPYGSNHYWNINTLTELKAIIK